MANGRQRHQLYTASLPHIIWDTRCCVQAQMTSSCILLRPLVSVAGLKDRRLYHGLSKAAMMRSGAGQRPAMLKVGTGCCPAALPQRPHQCS